MPLQLSDLSQEEIIEYADQLVKKGDSILRQINEQVSRADELDETAYMSAEDKAAVLEKLEPAFAAAIAAAVAVEVSFETARAAVEARNAGAPE